MDLLNIHVKGFQWTRDVFGLEPQWTAEPNMKALEHTLRELGLSKISSVSIFAQGAFNKLYNIETDSGSSLMRVSLPVDPYYKTLSEVATIEWIQRNTSIPVPRVIAYQNTNGNPVEFEWILMTKMQGKPLEDKWRFLDYQTKSQLVKQFAVYAATLFRKRFSGIGNIYPDTSYEDSHPMADRMVSIQLFWGNHLQKDISRGPFLTSKDWMATLLSLSEHDCHDTLAQNLDEADVEDAERTLKIVKRLQLLLDHIFPGTDHYVEPSIIFHDDLSRHNILVDDEGTITGVVDWECVSALPLWKACYFPIFLESSPRFEMPNLGRYRRNASGEPDDLYWEHLDEYECTKLRQVFLDEIRSLEPKWYDIFISNQMKRDFDLAVRSCDEEFLAKDINEWIDDIAMGKATLPSLHSRLD